MTRNKKSSEGTKKTNREVERETKLGKKSYRVRKQLEKDAEKEVKQWDYPQKNGSKNTSQ